MRNYRRLLPAVVLAALTMAAMAQGQAPRRGGRNYDVTKETTVSGTVQEVKNLANRRGGGTHLALKTEAGVVDVHVGPSWYVAEQQFTLAAGDEVQVTGSKVGEAVIAREIKKEGKTLVLRDAAGIPKWRGRRAG